MVARERVGEGGEEFGVFGRVADRDADSFGKTHPGQRTNNDAFVEEFVAEGFGVRTEGDEEEIGFAGDGREAEFGEFVEKTAAFRTIGFDGAADVVDVIEGGKSGGLANAGDIERRAELIHLGDERGMTDAVADAESGEAVDLRESAEREDVVVLAEERERVGKIAALGVLAVGLVEDDEDVARNFLEEGREFCGTESGAGGIVGIGDVDDTGLRSDGGGDGVEIEGVILHGSLDEIGAAGANGDGEEREGTFAGDAVKAGAEENAGGEVDDLTGAEADKNFFKTDVVAGGEDFAEMLAAAIGIPVGFAESAAGSFHGFGRGAERIFVGSEFDGVDLEFLLDFFDGLAGDVGGEALDVIGDEFFEGVRHEVILCRR